MQILHIDDDRSCRRLVSKILRAAGHQMLEAENGLQGVEIAAQERPDLILMDMTMPVMDGFQATECLRNSDDGYIAATPIIAMTALNMHGDWDVMKEAGCDYYLPKPITKHMLLNLVRRVEQQREAHAG